MLQKKPRKNVRGSEKENRKFIWYCQHQNFGFENKQNLFRGTVIPD